MKPAQGFAVIALIAGAIIFFVGLFFAARYYENHLYKKAADGLQYDYSQTNSPSPAIKTYETQEECESATGKSCSILMCDVVPEGKTFEETCGAGFKTGWAPSKLNNSSQSGQNSDETANWKTYNSPIPTAFPLNVTENWKTYENKGIGISFKYPDNFKLLTENQNRITFGAANKTNNDNFAYLTIETSEFTNYQKLERCTYEPQMEKFNFPCLSKEVAKTKLNGVPAEYVYVRYGIDGDYQLIKTVEKPSIELKMYVSGGGLGWTFDQILSTFKFLK